MAWRRYSNTDSRREMYDRLITASPYYPVYLLSWYLDVVCPDWEFFLDEERSLVIPVPVKRKWGLRYAIQPLWVQQLGIFGYAGDLDTYSLATTFSKGLLFSFFRVRQGQFSSEQVKEHRNAILALNKAYETIRAGYHDQIGRHLKKAEKAGIRVSNHGAGSEVFDLFEQSRGRDIRVPLTDMRATFFKIEAAALSHGMAKIWRAEDQSGRLMAAAFFLEGKDRTILLLSGASEEGREKGAMSALLDTVIRHYSGTDRLLDFEGSDQDGLFRFYSGFGAYEEHYSSVFCSSLPSFISVYFRRRLLSRV